MKHQYFADRRDFYKYELLLDLVDGLPSCRRLLSVLMLTPNDGTAEGSVGGYEVGRRRQDLFSFLKGCLTRGTRDVSLLREFMDNAGVEYRPFHDDSYFSDRQRSAYFASCAEIAREYPLIFFDPDIGLETGDRTYMRKQGIEKYLMYSDVTAVAENVAPESVVVVYQHLQRNKKVVPGDLQRRCQLLCRAVGSSRASLATHGDVAFLATSRSEELNTRAQEIVTSHGIKHGLYVDAIVADLGRTISHSRPQTRASEGARPRPSRMTSGQGGLGRPSHVGGTSMHVCIHTVSNRNGRQVMVAGLRLRELGYQRGASVEVTDPNEDPANEPWQYVVSNDEHATLVSRNPSPPDWIQPGVLIQIRVETSGKNLFDADRPLDSVRGSGSTLKRRSKEKRHGPGEASQIPNAAKRVSASDLADWRGALIRLLSALEDTNHSRANEGPAKTIARLTQEGRVPREVAALMRTVTEMRNRTEYDNKVLTASESEAVSAAWRAIAEWAENSGLDVDPHV